ncbi:MAG: GWxTD domain-containing protein [Gemmatimonadaceae bacterium]
MLTAKKYSSGLVLFLGSTILAACSSAGSGSNAQPNPRVLPAEGVPTPDVSDIYRQIGLLAAPEPVAFVGSVSSFASGRSDTTLVLTSISIPNRALTFSREGDRYRAPYEVRITLSRGGVEAANVNVMEIVRVGSFRETNRTDESIIFQHYFHVAPGVYNLSATVRDVGGSRAATQDATISVPSLNTGRLSTPAVVYEASGRSVLDSSPKLLVSPRSSAVFGRDSTVAIYVEGYGPGTRLPVAFVVRNDKGAQIWRDSVVLARNGALFTGIVNVPISTVGVGIARVFFTRRDVASGDSAAVPLFVTFGEDIPLMSFEDMLGYLRFFGTPSRINALRAAPLEKRASMWAEFLRATDPIPETPTNEEMQAYFGRIREANAQFRMDRNPGWLSDRGMVFVSLGEPDQVFERNVNQQFSTTQMASTARLQIWQYRQYNSQLVFYEDAGGWKLTRPSQTEFLSLAARRQR